MTSFETIKKFFSPVAKTPRLYIQNILEALMLTSYTVFSLEIIKHLLLAIEYKDSNNIESFIILYITVSVGVACIRFFTYKWGWTAITFEGSKIYYEYYLRKFIEAEGNDIERIGTGRFISVLTKGVHDWLNMLFELTLIGIINILFIFYAVFSIFRISFIAGLGSFLLIIISGYVATKANIYMREKRYLRRKEESEANHQAVIALMSKDELMQNNGISAIIKKISCNFELCKIYQYPVNVGFLVIDEFPKLMLIFIRVGVYMYLSSEILAQKASFSELAIFITIISLMELSMNKFLHLLRDILREISSVELLWKTFDTLSPMKGFNSGKTFELTKGDIVLENLSYQYTDTNIFQDFSLHIEGNKKTAFVGVSGSGKTTLMKILAGYLKPQKGTVHIFGNNISETSLKSYFKHIAYLTQEPSVFDGTIRENLEASTAEKPTIETMMNALKEAECDFVLNLEKGIDTEIGEKGIRLSGGQRQRIAIAKVFIKDPSIIFLDEPTSALDSFSEDKITKAMHRLFKGRTVIIIAHRLQTVKEADNIIVIEDGKVVERGTHKELIAKKGIYNTMLILQSGF